MLEARDIRQDFGSLEVLRGVSASVTPGRVLGVLGRNGCSGLRVRCP